MPSERTERMRSEFRFFLRSGAPAAFVEAWANGEGWKLRDVLNALTCDGNEERARAERIADSMGGEAFTTDGVWLVRIRREDGKTVIVGDDVSLFANEVAFKVGDDEQSIALR
jgi:hypothetical protein